MASTHLDALRGLSAILVAFGHARLMFVMDAVDAGGVPLWIKPFYFITNLGPSAVMIFFVLSGFFVGSGVIQSAAGNRWSWRSYIIARGARIYAVLAPALLLGVLFDLGGTYVFGYSPFYAQPHYAAMLPENIAANISWPIGLGNLLCLQDIFVPTLGSNNPLWSLANEFWYYFLFPGLWLALSPQFSRGRRLCAVATAMIIFLLLTADMRLLFGVWLMGAMIALLPRRQVKPWQIILVAALLVAWMMVQSLKITNNRFVTGLLTAMLVYGITAWNGGTPSRLYDKIAGGMAGFSYSFYLTHTPFLVFMAALVLGGNPKLHPGIAGMALTVGMLGLAALYAAGTWYLFERRTPDLKNWLNKVWHRQSIS